MQVEILFVFLYKKIGAGQPDGACPLRRHALIIKMLRMRFFAKSSLK
jgi:hypothetical protein